MIRRPPRSTLFPSPTLFRSAGTPSAAEAAAEVFRAGGNAADAAVAAAAAVSVTEPLLSSIGGGGFALVRDPGGNAELIDYYDAMPGKGLPASAFGARSEEHTSELQSRQYLVCRLLLEKKKI